MKHSNFLVALAALAAAGCTPDMPLSPNFDAQFSGTAREQLRPLQGHCETTFQVIGATETSISLLINGVCQLSHLGRTTTAGVQMVDFGKGTIHIEHGEYIAANGDRLFFSHDGYLGAPDAEGNPTFTGTHIFRGGTGRFADASGTASFTGRASIPNAMGQGTGHLQLFGRIAY
jgi:hypothetical protein